MSWTDERVELLRKMWVEGLSASKIAKELGGVTRNAVIGKVHRLGLSNRVVGNGAGPDPAPELPAESPAAAESTRASGMEPAAPGSAEVVHLSPGGGSAHPHSGAVARHDVPTPGPKPAIAAAAPAELAPELHAPVPPPASDDGPSAPGSFARRAVVPAGQPLPPQPSANEVSPEALATVREIEKKARRLTLLELTERTCKWPVGDPATEDFWFCGLPSQSGKPYCDAHVAVAFQPMSSRRDRRR